MKETPLRKGFSRPAGQTRHDAALLRASTELFTQEPAHDRDEIRRYEDLAAYLIPRVGENERAYVATRLAVRIDAPLSVVRMLARDTITIAEPILCRSPILAPFDLIAIIAATGPDHHRLIARRTTLDGDVERALRLTGDADTIAILDERPTEIANRQAKAAAPPLEPKHFLSLDRKMRLRIMADIANRSSLRDDAATPERAFRSVLNAARVAGFARAGRREELTAAIAEGLDLDKETVAACIADETGEPLAVLLRALALDAVHAQQVMLLASPVGYDPAAFFPLCDIFAGMERHVAEEIVDSWRTPAAGDRVSGHRPVYADTRNRDEAARGTARVNPAAARDEEGEASSA